MRRTFLRNRGDPTLTDSKRFRFAAAFVLGVGFALLGQIPHNPGLGHPLLESDKDLVLENFQRIPGESERAFI
jgi:hypothetical protein